MGKKVCSVQHTDVCGHADGCKALFLRDKENLTRAKDMSVL